MEIISSVNNEKVKHAASLLDKKGRRFSGAFLVEGEKLAREVLASTWGVERLYVQKEYLEKYQDLVSMANDVCVLTKPAFDKICYTETPQGIALEVRMRESADLKLNEPFLVLDAIQDPGNMGTIIRTAVAVGINTIITLNCVDQYSPKVVRASSGTILNCNFFNLDMNEFLDLVKRNGTKLYALDMNGENIFSFKNQESVYGLVVGSEGQGIRPEVRKVAFKTLSLPMRKEVESLNAGVSASIVMYLLREKDV